jgi:lysophospholipase L1-like esterase
MGDFCVLAASLIAQGQMTGWQLETSSSIAAEAIPVLPSSNQRDRCQSISARSTVSMTEVLLPEFSRRLSEQWLNLPAELLPRPLLPDVPLDESAIAFPVSVPAIPSIPKPTTGSQLYQQRWAALRAGRIYTRLPASSYAETWLNATEQPTYEQWVNLLAQEAAVMANGQGENRLTVLLGDSLSLWLPMEQLSRDRFWLNQGISGDTTAGVLKRLSAFANTRPDAIHVMIGINDLRQGATDETVLNNARQIMQRLRQAHPNAHVLIYSILPTRLAALPSDRIRSLNQRLAYIARQEQVSFHDLQAHFIDAQGNLRRDLTTDGLHLSRDGYAVWHQALQQQS